MTNDSRHERGERTNSLAKEAVLALILFIAVVGLYSQSLGLWFTWDDPWWIHVVATRPWSAGFVDSTVWSQRQFTPLLTVFYDALWNRFGLNATAWFATNLLLMWTASLVVYAVLRFYVQRLSALLAALLFVIGPILCSFATQLMLIHYFSSLILGTASAILFIKAVRDRRALFAAASACLYFAAILAKEIAAPLPMLLLFLPDGHWRSRTRYLIGHAIAAVAYLTWRWVILRTFSAGYGWAVTEAEIPGLIAELPLKLAAAIAGSHTLIGWTFLTVIVGVGLLAARTRRAILLIGLAFLLAALPILPVSKEMQPRYALAAWLLCCAIVALGLDKLRPRIIAGALVLVIGLLANRMEWKNHYALSYRMSEEARFYMKAAPNTLLRTPTTPPAAMAELRWLKEEFGRGERGASWFYDDIYLCEHPEESRPVYEYVHAARSVRRVASASNVRQAHCPKIRRDAPLTTHFTFEGDSLFWEFGPYHDGQYGVVIGNGLQAFDVPRVDGFRMIGVSSITLRVRYKSPNGWVTYSPELHLERSRKVPLQWTR